MSNTKRRWYIVLVLMVVSSFGHLSAVVLMFETSTGTISGFDLTISESDRPSNYEVSTQYYGNSGFIGRLVYQGAPCTLRFSNGGTVALQTVYNRFYFTRVDNSGTSYPSAWREFFLVTRTKGLYHGGGQHDYSNINQVVANNNGTIEFEYGAGFETVSVGQTGYNTVGQSGIYDGTNGYQYKYRYKYLWTDVTLIRTSQSKNLNNNNRGYFESLIYVSIDGADSLSTNLNLIGQYNPRSYHTEPDAYIFGVERTAPDLIPFSELVTKTNYQNAYAVGTLRFHSIESIGTVRFASNLAGTETNFQFSTTVAGQVRTFPYHVVFVPTIAAQTSPTTINSAYTSFNSKSYTMPTVIGGTPNVEQVLIGDLKIFVNTGLSLKAVPASTYSSIVYCFLTVN